MTDIYLTPFEKLLLEKLDVIIKNQQIARKDSWWQAGIDLDREEYKLAYKAIENRAWYGNMDKFNLEELGLEKTDEFTSAGTLTPNEVRELFGWEKLGE